MEPNKNQKESSTERIDFILEKSRENKKEMDPTIDIEEWIKFVIISLNSEYYAFFGRDIINILPYQKITFVPGLPDYILGIINVRGEIESVLSLHKLLNFGDKSEKHVIKRIVIAKNKDFQSGILTDGVVDVIDIAKAVFMDPIKTLDKTVKEFICGQIVYNEKYVPVFDIQKLFTNIKI